MGDMENKPTDTVRYSTVLKRKHIPVWLYAIPSEDLCNSARFYIK